MVWPDPSKCSTIVDSLAVTDPRERRSAAGIDGFTDVEPLACGSRPTRAEVA